MHITRAFLEGMSEASEQEINMIQVIDKHLEYCTGCFACKRNGGTCIHNDDMREILEEIESPMFNAPEADVVTKPRLELVKKAGKQYAESGAIDAGLLTEIGLPMIPEEVYAAIANGERIG